MILTSLTIFLHFNIHNYMYYIVSIMRKLLILQMLYFFYEQIYG